MLIVSVLVAAAALVLIPSLYLLGLTLVALLYKPLQAGSSLPRTRFAVLVPAHDEERHLPRLLESMRQVEYPARLLTVYVVADNCSDHTASIARSHGAIVYERSEPTRPGKPYALQWLFERVRESESEYDAYLFLDADTVVSPNLPSAIDHRFQAGSRVVQVHYAVSSDPHTPASTLRQIGFALMNYVRPMGKATLGLPSGLFGTGMGFRREMLDTRGWDSLSLAEDAELSLKLLDCGVFVDFAPEAQVWSEMPGSFREAKGQNLRWEKGRLHLAWRYGLRFVLQGALSRDPARLTAGLDQLIPPLSVIFGTALLLLGLSVAAGERAPLGLGLASVAALVGHVIVGAGIAGLGWRAYRALAFAPWLIIWKATVYAQALAPGEHRWTRTGRRD